jgi:hypothetical protein
LTFEPVVNIKIDEKQSQELPGLSIWIDSYDEIFSDFDPRPFSTGQSLTISFIM